MTEERALQLIQKSFAKLKETDLVEGGMVINGATALLGAESPLDSIGFVTFITDLEERIAEETQSDIYLVLNEISDFNVDRPQLSVDGLAQHIVGLSKEE